MTSEERTRIKLEIDRRARLRERTDPKLCAGCHIPVGEYTVGCPTCRTRRQRRILKLERDVERAKAERQKAVDQARFLHGVLIANGIEVRLP